MLRYKLQFATVGVHQGAAHPVAVTIPSGTTLQVTDDSADANGFVEVEWHGERLQIFAVDLQNRGQLIKVRSAGAGG